MCIENGIQLSLNSEIFSALKEDFDAILERTIGNMETKGADEATVTLKLGISLKKEQANFGEDEDKEITRPEFKHDISSVMQVKDKKSGSLSGDYELVYDEEEKNYVMRKIKDNQISFFEEDSAVTYADYEEVKTVEAIEYTEPKLLGSSNSENSEPSIEEYAESSPFGYLGQFIGEQLFVKESNGNYTVRSKNNDVILTSGSDPESIFHCDAEILAPHVGHEIVCVGYGGKRITNISVECETCCETLYSLELELKDREEGEEEFGYDFPEDF